ncbi:MAG: hypothetical protein JKY24_08705 [Pseudomonadales bacterium]|nr:hypothetical protein [Pseudomonadales bacterium]
MLPNNLRSAFEELDKLKDPKWAYTLISKDNNRELEVRFDPSENEGLRYNLLSVDGREPTDDERHQFQDRKTKANKKSFSFNVKSMPNMAKIVHHSSLTKVAENDDVIRYQFDPVLDIPIIRNVMRKMRGELSFCKKHKMISDIRIENITAFSPIPSFNISQFFAEAYFQRDASGQLQLHKTESLVRGKKFFVSSLHQATTTLYSDYVRVIAG